MIDSNLTWFVISTRSNCEKKIYKKLLEKSIEAYLPLWKKLKQWSDRKKWVEEPLIRSYLFVRIESKNFYEVLNIPGVVKFVAFSGRPVPIPDHQMEIYKNLFAPESEIEVSQESFERGALVEIIAGRLKGLTGELIQYKGSKRVNVRIDHLEHSFILNIPPGYLARRKEVIVS